MGIYLSKKTKILLVFLEKFQIKILQFQRILKLTFLKFKFQDKQISRLTHFLISFLSKNIVLKRRIYDPVKRLIYIFFCKNNLRHFNRDPNKPHYHNLSPQIFH